MKKVYSIQHGKSVIFMPLLFLLILPFILGYSAYAYPGNLGTTLIFSGMLMLPYILPELYLNYQYWKNDYNQVLTIDLSKREVEITKGDTTARFSVEEVVSCDFINVRPGTRIYRDHAYLRIKTLDENYIITHLTVRPEVLLGELRLSFNDYDVFFPNLDYEKISSKQKAKNQAYFEGKKHEFLKRYDALQESELEEILKDRGRYADYAVEAAFEILNKRRVNSIIKV
ncbi:hypothetical protein [Pontibacter burrus]|uniref:PH domain-containing protein n=1 Tax=Pontibacter burrus TaxID=2704466 RepID=A0A6B3LVB7_9BACT|nr:hypothetical protein [Pontibacter burrus]NEM98945.1 hypothetical protein [Pontibacter burrus]